MQPMQFNKASPFDLSEALMAYREADQYAHQKKYRDELMQAQLEQARAQTKQSQLNNQVLSRVTDRRSTKNGEAPLTTNPAMQQNAQTIMQDAGGNANTSLGEVTQEQSNPLIKEYLNQKQQQTQFSSAEDLQDALLESRALGHQGQAQYEFDAQGNTLAITPSGEILNLGPIRESPQQHEDIKYRAQQKNELENKYLEAATESYVLDELDSLFNSGIFDDINENAALFGKWNSGFYKAFGTEEQQEALAKAAVLTGELVTNMSARFKGVFRAGEQHLVESMKPNVHKDSPAMLKAKTRALQAMNTLFSQRQKYMLDVMESNPSLSRHKALDMANKYIDDKKIKEAANLNQYMPNQMNISPERLEYTMNKYNLTEEQVREHLKHGTTPDDKKKEAIARLIAESEKYE